MVRQSRGILGFAVSGQGRVRSGIAVLGWVAVKSGMECRAMFSGWDSGEHGILWREEWGVNSVNLVDFFRVYVVCGSFGD